MHKHMKATSYTAGKEAWAVPGRTLMELAKKGTA